MEELDNVLSFCLERCYTLSALQLLAFVGQGMFIPLSQNNHNYAATRSLMNFCQSFADLYGREHCTISMHLHGHIVECIRDYVPVYSFWWFAFERMNGILGSYHANNQHISIQFTRRFVDSKLHAPVN